MARTKKVASKKSKKIDEDELVDDPIESDEEQEVPKKKTTRKTSRTTVSRKKKSDNVDTNDDNADNEEDELSDIDIDEEDGPVESADNDEIVSTKKGSSRPPPKKIDATTPIGELRIDDVLRYLIQYGDANLNPRLRSGAANLLRDITGRKPRRRYGSKSNIQGGYNGYGSKSNRFGPGQGGQGYYQAHGQMDMPPYGYSSGRGQPMGRMPVYDSYGSGRNGGSNNRGGQKSRTSRSSSVTDVYKE